MKVEIYSDIVCPWCYIGKRRFERAAAAYPGSDEIEIVFRPFQLDPEAPRAAVPLLDYLEKRFGGAAEQMTRQVGAIARAEGISIDWDRALVANTLEAHKLLGFVERVHGAPTQRELTGKLFEAHFSNGLDIGDADVLARIASSVGVDPEQAQLALGSGDDEARLLDQIAEARGMGIKAVPTFIFEGKYMVEGAQASTVFRQVIDQVARNAREQEPV